MIAVAIVVAVVAQLRSSIDYGGAGSDTTAVLVNFFSYFTVDSNLLTVAICLAGALTLARRDGPEPARLTLVRASVTTYMVITGIVYNLLLRAEAPSPAIVTWSNEILHVVGPLYVLLDWLLAPGRNPVRQREVLAVVAFPIVWAVYTLLRGPSATDPYTHATHWYPYPFLNPYTLPGGYASVSLYVVGIAIVVIGVASALCWASRRWTPALG